MGGKMAETRFTIQFSRTDPSHLQVAEILNRQGRRSKAQYIVNAVLHYENCNETPHISRSAELDEKVIEAVVNRILQNREEKGQDRKNGTALGKESKKEVQTAKEISIEDALAALGPEGFNVVVGTLDMFRKK